MPYTLNPKRHYKIWLSKNPELFMPKINQLRLVQMRVKNPSATISLVYDSSLLSAPAIAACTRFCEQHRICLCDAQELIRACRSDSSEERILRDLYLDEITNLDKGGNLGSASDKLRLLSPVYILGIYTDFDVDVNTEGLAEQITVQAPLLMQISSYHKHVGDTQEYLSVNNDCLAVVCPEAAKTLITQIQQVGIYLSQKQTKGHRNETYGDNDVPDISLHNLLQKLSYEQTAREIRYSIQKLCRHNETFFRFLMHPDRLKVKGCRIFFDTAPVPTPEHYHAYAQKILAGIIEILPMAKPIARQELLKILANPTQEALLDFYRINSCNRMLRHTVIDTMGPTAYAMGIFRTNYLPITEIKRRVLPFALAHYDGLQEAIYSCNGYGLHVSEAVKNQRTENPQNDLSWAAFGAEELSARDTTLDESAQKIQDAWRRKHPSA